MQWFLDAYLATHLATHIATRLDTHIATRLDTHLLADRAMNDVALSKNIAKLRERIRVASQNWGREPGAVSLLAVSKTRPAESIRQAAAEGIADFGENYVQEALDKMAQLEDLPLRWHFIGPIQSNKTRAIAENFDWVHSIDRLKIARRLSEQRPASMPPLQVCIQVNISAEASKAGEQREPFAAMRLALASLQAELPGLDTLSMGMSADLEAAICEGATMVRIGTALFGPRPGSSN